MNVDSPNTELKFTDQEMERVLSAHAGGQMKRGGGFMELDHVGCAMQVAFNHHSMFGVTRRPETGERFSVGNCNVAMWFDNHYKKTWTPEQLLESARAHGVF